MLDQWLDSYVQGGCDLRICDNTRNSPLRLAAGCGFLDAVVKLVELGGDLNSESVAPFR